MTDKRWILQPHNSTAVHFQWVAFWFVWPVKVIKLSFVSEMVIWIVFDFVFQLIMHQVTCIKDKGTLASLLRHYVALYFWSCININHNLVCQWKQKRTHLRFYCIWWSFGWIPFTKWKKENSRDSRPRGLHFKWLHKHHTFILETGSLA